MIIEYNNLQRNYFIKIKLTLLYKIYDFDTVEYVENDTN